MSILIFGNLLLTDAVVYAAPFEAKLNDIRQNSPQDLTEFGLVNVIVEEDLEKDRDIAQKIQNYCKNVQKVTGAVCQITPWKGETPSRIVEALQQMYFEGVEVKGGLAKLVGIVLIGEVPLPVVHQGENSFPSIYPYTDLVHPAYVYDSSQAKFIRSSVSDPRQEIFHGIIRPPGKTVSERTGEIRKFFLKNEKFYAGDPSMAVFEDAVGFQDQFWENASFDNEAKKWYLKKIASLDRIMNYRYSGEWLKQLSGESEDRLKQLLSQKFDDAPVKIDPKSRDQSKKDAGFDSAAISAETNKVTAAAKAKNPNAKQPGKDEFPNQVPDPFSPGPIRNLLKDYVHVVQRYVSGTSDLSAILGRRQEVLTLPVLITILDRFSAATIKSANDAFEAYFLDQAKQLALAVEISDSFVNGVPAASISSIEQCSLSRGSSLKSDTEQGQVVSFNRKNNPLTSQDVAGVKGKNAKKDIEKIYGSFGSCSYQVKEKCNPKTSTKPLLDFTTSERVSEPNDYRQCLNASGTPMPKDPKNFLLREISSLVDHREPTGKTVTEMQKGKMGFFFPMDAVRHASFYLGGGSMFSELNVGKLRYPNLFDLLSGKSNQSVQDRLSTYLRDQEKVLRKIRVDANWKRFALVIALSTPGGFGNIGSYRENATVDGDMFAYQEEVMKVLRTAFDPEKIKDDVALVEEYLLATKIPDDVEKKIEELFKKYFFYALADSKTSGANAIGGIQKNTLDQVKTLRQFYRSSGSKVAVSFPYKIPINIVRSVSPVRLKGSDELKSLSVRFGKNLETAIRWLNLGIEAKHREALEILSQKKALTFLTVPGDATRMDFNLSSLQESLTDDAGGAGFEGEDILNDIKKKEEALQKKLEEARKEDAGDGGGESGGKGGDANKSVCGESVPLLKWPGAVMCWIQKEVLKQPIIEMPDEGGEKREGAGLSESGVRDFSTPPHEAAGSVEMTKSKRAVLKAESGQDLQIGNSETATFSVQITDQKGTPLISTETLQVGITEIGLIDAPAEVSIKNGKGTLSVKPGRKAGIAGVFVQSDTVTKSRELPVNVLAGKPAKIDWEDGDHIFGLDRTIEETLQVTDQSGNPVRAEVFRVLLSWSPEFIVNDKEGTSAAFFVVNGKLKLNVSLKKQEEGAQEKAAAGVLFLQIDSVEGNPQLTKPQPLRFDSRMDYRVRFQEMPQRIRAGEDLPVTLEVASESGVLALQKKSFALRTEINGFEEKFTVEMKGERGVIRIPTEKSAGTLKLSIDDADFGMANAEVQVQGSEVRTLVFQQAELRNGKISLHVIGQDENSNPATLRKRLILVHILEKGGKTVLLKNFTPEEDELRQELEIPKTSDRLKLIVSLGGGDPQIAKTLEQDYSLNLSDLKKIPWGSPFMVLSGAAFGDYREPFNVAAGILFSDVSKVQALTTVASELASEDTLLKIFPSGRIDLSIRGALSVIVDHGKPVLVLSEGGKEYARMFIDYKNLDFEVQESEIEVFEWSRENNRHKSVLVPESGFFEKSGARSGELFSQNGIPMLRFDDGVITLLDDQVRLALSDEEADALVLEFSRGTTLLATWYLNFEGERISSSEAAALYLALDPAMRSQIDEERFFSGESTSDPTGLALKKKSNSAVSDRDRENAAGFIKKDKTGLLFLSGNSVGESTLSQNERMINYGDPMISLRQAKKKTDEGAVVPLIDQSEFGAEHDFGIGQLIYRPERGRITHLLRAEVEGDQDEDLLVIVDDGKQSVVRYLEGNGEGMRFGDVSDLMNLGQGVKDVLVIQKKNLLTLYESGQISIQDNQSGVYQEKILDLAFLKKLNQASVRIQEIQVADFDLDKIDDLVLLTGTREIWILYGSVDTNGFSLGVSKKDQELIGVIPVNLKKPENLLTGVWVRGDRMPKPDQLCPPQQIGCTSQFLRPFEGKSAPIDETADRMALLLKQVDDAKPIFEDEKKEKEREAQKFLVRLDKAREYADTVKLTLKNLTEGSPLNAKQKIPIEMTISPRASEKNFVLRLDLGQDFEMVQGPTCEGCGKTLKVNQSAPQSLFSLEGELTPGKKITLRFTLEMTNLPNFSLQILKTNDDAYPDVGVNVEANQTGAITVFESRDKRRFVETVFGESAEPTVKSAGGAGGSLVDLMKGIGVQGKTTEDVKKLILEEQKKVGAKAGKLFEDTLRDDNNDGYPDVYQEGVARRKKEATKKISFRPTTNARFQNEAFSNITLESVEMTEGDMGISMFSQWARGYPQVSSPPTPSSVFAGVASAAGPSAHEKIWKSPFGHTFASFLFPSALAATESGGGDDLNLSDFTALDDASGMVDDIGGEVGNTVKMLKCSKGCLPVPMNFSFLTPGTINVFGTPAGFDPGLPVFGFAPIFPLFIWPPLLPYQSSIFRIYVSPTLTMGLGMGVCVGPWLKGQCRAFTLPISQFGSEAICDAAKASLKSIVRGIQQTVGEVKSGLQKTAASANRTGVMKARVGRDNNLDEAESYIGIKLGGGSHQQGANKDDSHVSLEPVPKIFVEWWDRQFEEIVNSLSNLPDITLRVPKLQKALGDRKFWNKMEKKIDDGAIFANLNQVYDFINSLPLVELNPVPLQIQIPWIEPSLLRKVEESLSKFIIDFAIEVIAFIRSFNVPCTITENRDAFYAKLISDMKRGKSQLKEEELKKIKALMKKLVEIEEREKSFADKKKAIEKLVNEERARLGIELGEANKAFNEAQRDKNKTEEDKEKLQRTVGVRDDLQEKMEEYFEELLEFEKNQEDLDEQFKELEDDIRRVESPKSFMVAGNAILTAIEKAGDSWGKQIEHFGQKPSDDLSEFGAEALRSCVALKFGADLLVDVKPFVEGIQKNLEALDAWKKFPRELAKYLNTVEFYITELVTLIDQITQLITKWWKTFQKRLDLWISAVLSFEELLAMIDTLIEILKGYNQKCGLCTSDRLTLKEMIMKVLFGVVPKFPIIDFPDWPDIKIDLSDIKASLDLTVPVFDTRALDLQWPGLPTLKLPRFKDLQISAGGELSVGFSLKVPKIPLLIPEPPKLPPLEPFPKFPKLNLPNLPPAPELPRVLESLLPLMKIIQTVLNIWCLINKAIIPMDETLLKTEIENLTNRSGNLILPIDLMLTLDLAPGDLVKSIAPFDLIEVKTKAELGLNLLPDADQFQSMLDEQFHKPMNAFVDRVNQWMKDLKNASQKGLDAATKDPLQQILDKTQEFKFEPRVQQEFKNELDLKEEFPELENIEPLEFPPINEIRSAFGKMIAAREQSAVNHHHALQQALRDYQKIVENVRQIPENELAQRFSSLSSDQVLAEGKPGSIFSRVSAEKRAAYFSPENLEKKTVAFIDKPKFIAALQDKKSNLEELQNSMMGTAPPISEILGVTMIRDGEARRIQDYPLSDPAILVWDNDILLAYEGAVFLKTLDNSARRHPPYQGSVLRKPLRDYQRSKVHQLTLEAKAGKDTNSETVTFTMTWDSPGVRDLELTLWDSVGKTQRLDQEHTRFFLKQKEEENLLAPSSFQGLEPGLVLNDGADLEIKRRLSLRFGLDRLMLEKGLSLRIPSLIDRDVKISGNGKVTLENFSGKPWSLDIQEGVTVIMTGMVEMTFTGPGSFKTPGFEKMPRVKKIRGKASGLMRKRTDLVSGEVIPIGQFYALNQALLEEKTSGATLSLFPGFFLDLENSGTWLLKKGRGQIITGEPIPDQEAKENQLLLPNEMISGAYLVEDQGRELLIREGQQVNWAQITGSSFEVTVPRGNYYARVREAEGKRGFSPIVLAAGDKRNLPFAKADIVGGGAPGTGSVESKSVALYQPLIMDAKAYVIGDLPDESFHWRLEGDERFITGPSYLHPGFETVGKRKLELFVRNGEYEVKGKTFEIDVFLPKLSIDEKQFQESRMIQVMTEPRVGNIPIGILGRRDGAEDWLLSPTVRGTKADERYFTDAQGMVELEPLPALEGLHIVIEEGFKVARLFPNGRVVLNPEYQEQCQNDPMLDQDGYLKFRVSCLEEGKLVKKFDVRMGPDRDTDAVIVETFSNLAAGVSVRALQASIELRRILPAEKVFPAGVQASVIGGDVIFMISREGQVELLQQGLNVRIRPDDAPENPVIWQLMQGDTIFLEFTIKGPSNTAIVDPVDREALTGDSDQDGMADRWEIVFDVREPHEDPDLDGLTNQEEFRLGTHPKNRDTDGDGFSDAEDQDPVSSKIASKKTAFLDVPASRPDAEAIRNLAKLGFIKGYEGEVFKPDQPVTRAEALKMLMSTVKCENCQSPSTETRKEFDPGKQTIEEFVKFHENAGFYNQPRDKARGRQPMTNDQMTNDQKSNSKSFAFTEKELEPLLPSIGSYFDVRVEDWYYYCVEIATKLGLVHGYRGIEEGKSALGKFIPGRGVNIAELAKMVVEAIGMGGKKSDTIYGSKDGWWNDPNNNYLAAADLDLKLFLSEEAYRNPLREATRAEVAYAANQVLKIKGDVNNCPVDGGRIDGDGTGAGDQTGRFGREGIETETGEGVGEDRDRSTTPKETLEPRSGGEFFSGIEITQFLTCRCLALVKADLFPGSTFFAVITGKRDNDRQVYVKSNEVTAVER